MKKQLYKEVSKGEGIALEKVSDIELKKAKEEYAKTGKCKHKYVYYKPGNMYANRYCGICGKQLNLYIVEPKQLNSTRLDVC